MHNQSLNRFWRTPKQKPNSHPPVFPPEIFEKIAESLMELTLPERDAAAIYPLKPPWHEVYGFLSASVALHQMGFVRWVRVLKIRSPGDWERILELAHLVQ